MINCIDCGFGVDNKLRFALMKNECPACGKNLFSAEDMNHISMIQSKILLEKFSDKFNEAEAYDISLFIFNEMKYGIGTKIIKPQAAATVVAEKSDAADQIAPPAFDPDEIRREIEQEIPEVATLPDISIDEDVGERTRRLQKVAAKSPFIRKPGALVKRVN